MFRIPSLAELAGLFWRHRSVASATSAITGTVSRLEEVAEHHQGQAVDKTVKAAELRTKANGLSAEVAEHRMEAHTAANVASKLNALLS